MTFATSTARFIWELPPGVQPVQGRNTVAVAMDVAEFDVAASVVVSLVDVELELRRLDQVPARPELPPPCRRRYRPRPRAAPRPDVKRAPHSIAAELMGDGESGTAREGEIKRSGDLRGPTVALWFYLDVVPMLWCVCGSTCNIEACTC